MSVAPALSTEVTYDRVPVAESSHEVYDISKLNEIYHTDEIAAHILANNYAVPCLQFPDHLLEDASQIASAIESSLGDRFEGKVYILADSAYSPCCVDEVAAQHVKGDVVYHFGNACLNPVNSISPVYILHGQKVDMAALQKRVEPYADDKAILYADTDLTHIALDLAQRTGITVALPTRANFIPALENDESFVSSFLPNRLLPADQLDQQDRTIIYISSGSPSDSLLLHLTTLSSGLHAFNVMSPECAEISLHHSLQKRYRLVNMAKAAGTIGILVNTLSLRHTTEVLQSLKQWLTSANKKYYVFVVGKPNVPKLANFEAIDLWVVLGCSMGGVIVESGDFYKPIITPYELQMALNDEWTGKWLLDFAEILELDVKAAEDDGEPLFDSVTGKYITTNQPLKQTGATGDRKNTELANFSQSLTVKNTTSTAAEFLQTRSWTGLGSDLGDHTETFADLKIGRSGVARNYTSGK